MPTSIVATLSRRASAGVAAKPLPVLRVRKGAARSGSRKPVSSEPERPVKTQLPTAETFHEMFARSRPKFVAAAYSILRNMEDAEDAVQNAYISGYLDLRNFQGRSALKTWFTRVVLNAALMILRKRKRIELASAREWTAEDSDESMYRGIPSPEPDTETICANAEALGLIEGWMAQLRPALRQAFWMYYAEEMSVRQACLVAGVSTATFKARLFRARHQVIGRAKRALALRPQKSVTDGVHVSAVS